MCNYGGSNAEKRLGLKTMPLILGEFRQSRHRRNRRPGESRSPEIPLNEGLDSGFRRNDGRGMVPPGCDSPTSETGGLNQKHWRVKIPPHPALSRQGRGSVVPSLDWRG